MKAETYDIKSELKKLKDKNEDLKRRVEMLEMRERSQTLIFNGIPVSSFAEAASATADENKNRDRPNREDTASVVMK